MFSHRRCSLMRQLVDLEIGILFKVVLLMTMGPKSTIMTSTSKHSYLFIYYICNIFKLGRPVTIEHVFLLGA